MLDCRIAPGHAVRLMWRLSWSAVLLSCAIETGWAQRSSKRAGPALLQSELIAHRIRVTDADSLPPFFSECCPATSASGLEAVADRMMRVALDAGHPLATVQLDSIGPPEPPNPAAPPYTAFWRVTLGAAADANRTRWNGIERLNPGYLLSRVPPHELSGNPQRAVQRLEDLHSVERAQFEGWTVAEAPASPSGTALPVYSIRERPGVSLEGVLGLASGGRSRDPAASRNVDRNPAGAATGSAKLSIRDLGAEGVHLSADLLRTDPLRSRTDLRLGYQSGWAGNLDLEGSLRMAQQDSLYLERTFALEAEADLARGTRWRTGLHWQQVLAGAGAAEAAAGSSIRSVRVEAGFRHASRTTWAPGSSGFIADGWRAQLRSRFTLLGGRQTRLDASMEWFEPLGGDASLWVVRLSGMGSSVRNASGRIPPQDLIRAGGASDVRGYPQEGLQAAHIVHGSLDVRWHASAGVVPFGYATYGAAWFQDAQPLEPHEVSSSALVLQRERLLSYGFGFLTAARTGKLALTAAFRPGERFGNGQLHVQWTPR